MPSSAGSVFLHTKKFGQWSSATQCKTVPRLHQPMPRARSAFRISRSVRPAPWLVLQPSSEISADPWEKVDVLARCAGRWTCWERRDNARQAWTFCTHTHTQRAVLNCHCLYVFVWLCVSVWCVCMCVGVCLLFSAVFNVPLGNNDTQNYIHCYHSICVKKMKYAKCWLLEVCTSVYVFLKSQNGSLKGPKVFNVKQSNESTKMPGLDHFYDRGIWPWTLHSIMLWWRIGFPQTHLYRVLRNHPKSGCFPTHTVTVIVGENLT